jgi:hypothetical protein
MSTVSVTKLNDDKPDIWTSDIENILDSIRQNSVAMSEEHKKKYMILQGKLRYFRVPVIIISGVNSVVSVGLQPYIPQGTISLVTCLLSLVCGIIGSVELYLAIQTTMDSELLVSREYYILSARIFTVLALDVDNRKIDGMDFFEEVFAIYTSLMNKSIFISKKIADRLLPIEDMVIVKAKRDKRDKEILNSLSNKKGRRISVEKYYQIDYNDDNDDDDNENRQKNNNSISSSDENNNESTIVSGTNPMGVRDIENQNQKFT